MPSAILHHPLLQHPIVREAFGVVVSLAIVVGVEPVAHWVLRRRRHAVRRAEPWLTAAAALWMVWAFRHVAFFPSAIFVAAAGFYATGRSREAAARVANQDLVRDAFFARQTLHVVCAGLALFFWWQGWMFNMIGPVLGHVTGRAAQDVAHRRWGRRDIRTGEGQTVEGLFAYAAVTLVVQFLIYWNWSQIPGVSRVGRVLLWTLLASGASVVARLYSEDRAAMAVVPIVTTLALYVYVIA